MHVQMPSASCTCSVFSRSVINDVVTGDVVDVDAVSLLRISVRRAQELMSSSPRDLVWVHQVLADLAAALAPVSAHLEAVADAQPAGAVAAVLGYLREAFTHAGAGRAEQAMSCVLTAMVTAFRLADDAALDAEAAGHTRCR